MSEITIRVDEKELCCRLLDLMTNLIQGNEEWDAYHQFHRVMQKRFYAEGYRIYLDCDCKHAIEKIES